VLSEAFNSGKTVKATKRMFISYLCTANSWSAVAHFPRTYQASMFPIPLNNKGARKRGRWEILRGIMKNDGRTIRNAANRKSTCSPFLEGVLCHLLSSV
jgi:hypothetical protein